MTQVDLVWYDGFGRHREIVTLVATGLGYKKFQDSEGVEFTVQDSQIVKMGDTLTPEDQTAQDGYQ